VLRRPQKTDAQRYPRDAVIGELGAGDLTREHLDFAREAVRALTQGRERAGVFGPLGERHTSELVAKVVALKPVKFRVGGGKEAADGAFTFLFRVIGSEGQIGGEVYFTQGETAFRLDDIVLDEIPDTLLDDDKNRTYNLSPYERFY
jgi:hypothetical protein